MTESSQTGNKTPKPFIYENLMTDILKDDPAFNPPVVKGHWEKEKRSLTRSQKKMKAGRNRKMEMLMLLVKKR